MGEHPPLLTPQGPGVPRARRPGFPRVEDSGTSCSPFVIFRLLNDLSLFCRLRFRSYLSVFSFHDSIRAPPRVSPPLLPKCFPQFPSPSLRPVLSTSFPTFPRPRFILIPLRACISAASLSLSPSLRPVPPISSPLAFPSTDVPALPRSPFESRFYRLGFEARFCGPRVAPKRPHTTPPERQRTQGCDRHINLS